MLGKAFLKEMIFSKGNSNGNSFLLVLDTKSKLIIKPETVSILCNHRFGIGADGIIKVAKAGYLLNLGILDHLNKDVSPSDWYMDYWNSDGSVAQICGNGIRLLAHYLYVCGLEENNEFIINSRYGSHLIIIHKISIFTADITVEISDIDNLGTSNVILNGHATSGTAVYMLSLIHI